MGARDYIVSKALRLNRELSNRELDERLQRTRWTDYIPNVTGKSDFDGIMNAEKHHRTYDRMSSAERRQFADHQQRERIGSVTRNIGLGGGALALKRAKVSPKRMVLSPVESARKLGKPKLNSALLGAGATAAVGGQAVSTVNARQRKAMADRKWRRLVRDNPNGST